MRMRVARKAAYALLALAIFLAVVEVLARLAAPWIDRRASAKPPTALEAIQRPAPDLLFTMKPSLDLTLEDGTRLTTNSWGFRTPEPVLPKPPGVFRILSLGESSTMGLGVDQGQDYTSVLTRSLNESCSGRPTDAFNAGTFGWTSYQNVTFFASRGLALAPDMVIFYVLHNDVTELVPDEINREYFAAMGWKERPRTSSLGLTDRQKAAAQRAVRGPLAFLTHSAAFRLAAEGLVGGSRRVLPKKGVVRVTEQERQQNLQRLVRVAEERHIAVLLLDPPLPAVHPVRRWLGDRYGEDLRAAADGHAGVRVLDLNAILANEPPSNIFQWDNVHPTANGHRRIAEEIARFMKDHHLPPCDGRGS